MIITIVDINHNQQKYETVGDWRWDKRGNLTITVSDMKNWRYNILVGIHELIETMLCRHRGISETEVTNFDLEYEARRLPEDTTSEPGNSELAPYHKEHLYATKIEFLLAQELGVSWEDYEKAIYSL